MHYTCWPSIHSKVFDPKLVFSITMHFIISAKNSGREATIWRTLMAAMDREQNSRLSVERNIPGRLSYTIATGRAKFGSDFFVPDMLYAKFLRNPHGRATIKSVDISKAKAMEGVVDILTWDDPDIKNMTGTRELLGAGAISLITSETGNFGRSLAAV